MFVTFPDGEELGTIQAHSTVEEHRVDSPRLFRPTRRTHENNKDASNAYDRARRACWPTPTKYGITICDHTTTREDAIPRTQHHQTTCPTATDNAHHYDSWHLQDYLDNIHHRHGRLYNKNESLIRTEPHPQGNTAGATAMRRGITPSAMYNFSERPRTRPTTANTQAQA